MQYAGVARNRTKDKNIVNDAVIKDIDKKSRPWRKVVVSAQYVFNNG